jgi:catechol 2,3-dioxygenase-like lactoylglutathione lyase family enzyme
MATTLSHLFMVVSDLEAARRLLVDTLGLELLVEYPGYLRVGGGDGFHMGLEQGDPGPPGSIEITIAVDDADAAHARLVAAGIDVEGPPEDQPWGARHVWFRDFDGRRMSAYS